MLRTYEAAAFAYRLNVPIRLVVLLLIPLVFFNSKLRQRFRFDYENNYESFLGSLRVEIACTFYSHHLVNITGEPRASKILIDLARDHGTGMRVIRSNVRDYVSARWKNEERREQTPRSNRYEVAGGELAVDQV